MANGVLSPTSPGPSYLLGRSVVPLMSVLFPELDGSYAAEIGDFRFDVGTWTLTRDAAGQYGLVHLAKAETVNVALNLNRVLFGKIGSDPWLKPVGAEYWQGISDQSSLPGGGGNPNRGHYIRGVQLTGFDLKYKISTLALTSGTPALYRTVFANNTAPATTSPGGAITGTFATATQTNPYVTQFTVATPYVIGNNVADSEDWLEIPIVFQATSGFELYGANLYFNYVLL